MKSKLPPVKTSKDEALNPVALAAAPKLSRAGYSASQARVQGDPDLARLKVSDKAIDEVPGFKSHAYPRARLCTGPLRI